MTIHMRPYAGVADLQRILELKRVCAGCPAALCQGMRPPIYLLLFHHIERVAIEDAHQPGAKRAAALPARPPAPGQQKRSLGDFFRPHALVAEAQCCRLSYVMMRLPELLKGLLISTSGMPHEVSLASRHAYPPSVAIVHPQVGKRFPLPRHHYTSSCAQFFAAELIRCRTSN
jgi:hypothetical protein